MIHSSIVKFVPVIDVINSGKVKNLAKGQLAIVKDKANKQGVDVVSDFNGMSKKDRIAIKVGEATTPVNQRTVDVNDKSTGYFPMEQVIEITATRPIKNKLEVDHLEVGYDGIDDTKALYIPEGKSAIFDVSLYGDVASMFFGKTPYNIQKEVYRAEGQSMQEVVQKLVKDLQEENVPTATGWASVTDKLAQFLEIGVIDSSNLSLAGTDYTFSLVTIPDAGESNDLAVVQAQYPYKVEKVARKNGKTTYKTLHPSSVTLSDVSLVEVDSIFKGCEDCLAGYSTIPSGVVYHVSLEDDGANQTTLVDDLPGYISGTVVKLGNNNGVGSYSIVLDNELTQAEIDTFVGINAIASTAVISKRGTLEEVCKKTTTTTYAWSADKTCKASVKQFSIVLPDNECGQSRLGELQAAYPDLVIEEGVPTGNATQTITLTGTSGAVNVVINGVNYLTTFDTDLTTTASNFVTTHGANITAATGGSVSSALDVITYTDSSVGFPVVSVANAVVNGVNVPGDLSATLGVVDYVVSPAAGGCKRTYSTYMPTNLVCAECSDIYLQPFYADSPESFEGNYWKEFQAAFDENAKMGIFVKGKPFYIYPEQYEEDFVPYVETSLKVKSMTFGSKGSLALNYNGEIYDPELEFAESRKVKYAKDVLNDANSLFTAEDIGRTFFTGKDKHRKNLFARTNLSQERILKYHKDYVHYGVKIQDSSLSQGGAGRSNITFNFKYIVEYGKHTDLQNLLNKLAAKLGLETVNIL